MINKVILVGRVGSDPEVKMDFHLLLQKNLNVIMNGKKKLNGTNVYVGILT